MVDFDDEDIDKMINIYLEDILGCVKNSIVDGDTESGTKYPSDHLIPLILKRTYDSQEKLKKSQDRLNFLTAVLVVFTVVLAILTLLLYLKG